MKRNFQSGQATTEMIFILLGFAVLLLGIIFTLSLEIFNTRVLLDSKFRTEGSINVDNSALGTVVGSEIRGWDYKDGIPFSLEDTPVYFSGGEVTEGWFDLGTNANSAAENYAYEWRPLKDFTPGKFKADYKESTQSAMAAANLITRQGESDGRELTAKLPELHTAVAKLLGVKIKYDKLRENKSNRVYMPFNGEL